MIQPEMWTAHCGLGHWFSWTGPLTAKPCCPECGQNPEHPTVLEWRAARHKAWKESLAIIAEAKRRQAEENADRLPDPDEYWERIQ